MSRLLIHEMRAGDGEFQRFFKDTRQVRPLQGVLKPLQHISFYMMMESGAESPLVETVEIDLNGSMRKSESLI